MSVEKAIEKLTDLRDDVACPDWVQDDILDVLMLLAVQEAGVEPDWSEAPEWAEWWASTTYRSRWFENKPLLVRGGWMSSEPGETLAGERADLPLGIDWRTTLRARPAQTGGEGGSDNRSVGDTGDSDAGDGVLARENGRVRNVSDTHGEADCGPVRVDGVRAPDLTPAEPMPPRVCDVCADAKALFQVIDSSGGIANVCSAECVRKFLESAAEEPSPPAGQGEEMVLLWGGAGYWSDEPRWTGDYRKATPVPLSRAVRLVRYGLRIATLDGWVPHDGGECPVGEGVRVEVKLGQGDTTSPVQAKAWTWRHSDCAPTSRITHFRLVPQDKPAEPVAAVTEARVREIVRHMLSVDHSDMARRLRDMTVTVGRAHADQCSDLSQQQEGESR